jgi:hypothetical protein
MWLLKKVPKIAHFYWGCNRNMSYLRYLSIMSFKKFNPEWDMVLHIPKFPSKEGPSWKGTEQKGLMVDIDYYPKLVESNIKRVLHNFEDYGFSNNIHEVFKNDFLRWLLLYKIGGVWLDTDILFVKSIENISINIEQNCESDTILCRYLTGANAIGFIMASRDNLFFESIHRFSKKVLNLKDYQSIGSPILNQLFRRVSPKDPFFDRTKFLFMDPQSIYSINCEHNGISKFYRSDYHHEKKDGEIGYHWYGGSPMSQQYEAVTSNGDYRNFNNTMKTIIDEVIR